ncbi:hypothetical protein COCC4DRAFT_33614 [Bipolaris maydis ATCC 48331]|uniref:Uncharacterized protein n=2 Tax=Cochliobolus heterostrophus TaxID=5016 RepID=M2U1Y7_COCH5|nr:uncharacterized protein COCC4DRAFT_33614 [Bipolaris maydis ATCC 48331]EMD88056.1 hypothetical protein COCHEDRAFT_1023300 [Bipolaris maydis C5]ENI02361.1 hypothetical protein COCC4DRAFT_33614 [Bipolaris maydis ATCC 48331]
MGMSSVLVFSSLDTSASVISHLPTYLPVETKILIQNHLLFLSPQSLLIHSATTVSPP